jgi:hypothetical protein
MAEDPQTAAKIDQMVENINDFAAAIYAIRIKLEQLGVFGQGEFAQRVQQAKAQLQGGQAPQTQRRQVNAPSNSQPLGGQQGGNGDSDGGPPPSIRAA